jgi:SAM-dependent methyltransferase
VVADVANLPFKNDAFDGIVSLHTIHHVPAEERTQAYLEIYRTLKQGHRAVVVNGWTTSVFMDRLAWLVKYSEALLHRINVFRGKEVSKANLKKEIVVEAQPEEVQPEQSPTGTFVAKTTSESLRKELAPVMDIEILVWRSVSIRFLRAIIQPWAFGKLILRWIYALEEKDPQKYGEEGQYPMVVISKPQSEQLSEG